MSAANHQPDAGASTTVLTLCPRHEGASDMQRLVQLATLRGKIEEMTRAVDAEILAIASGLGAAKPAPVASVAPVDPPSVVVPRLANGKPNSWAMRRNPKAKAVRDERIRSARSSGAPVAEIARREGITTAYVYQILGGVR